MAQGAHRYNGPYTGEHLDRIAFPLGGMGAGMVCLEGTGCLSHVSLRHKPDVFHEPQTFAALHVADAKPVTRVIEGPVPMWKAFGPPSSGNGRGHAAFGLPRFRKASFEARFPFASLSLRDADVPVDVELTGWSPFIPLDADNSSLPVAALEYRFRNRTARTLKAVFSFHSINCIRMSKDSGSSVQPLPGGFAFVQPGTEENPWHEGAFAAFTDAPGARSDCAWFRGGWFDPLTTIWRTVESGGTPSRTPHADPPAGDGGSLYVPLTLKPRAERTVRLLLAWYVPKSDVRTGPDLEGEGKDGKPRPTYVPWYAGRFGSLEELTAYWRRAYGRLRAASAAFRDCFYDSTLPPEVVEAAAANLTILKSPTVLRQPDGRFWAYEGCCDGNGCCHGSCTHVWNYAQAVAHLFPDLERSLRETEFRICQDQRGHQNFRASLPIRPSDHVFHAAADGQLGGIMKTYREWRISGDTDWLRGLWPQVRQSLDYCIGTWDPDHTGTLVEPHHNTYDIEFWGPDGMCTSFYLGALKAAARMAAALGEDAALYESLFARGRRTLESELWNGDYFAQDVRWKGLRAGDPTQVTAMNRNYSPESRVLLEKEGPKYQYGSGCLADGILGQWIADMCGVGEIADPAKVRAHLAAVFRHNFRADLHDHANTQRPAYAFGQEGGLLLCTWPHGGKLTLPFPYCDEVWTGFEYQAASHLMLTGQIEQGRRIVRAARDRYDGRHRNPFNEYECGHWYARALSSYGLLQGLTGARYDAVDRTLYVAPSIKGAFRSFLCTATGYGTVGVRNGKPFLTVKQGRIPVDRIAKG